MTKQFSTTLRNYWLDGYESQIGTSPKLRLLSGSQPATCATAESGTLGCQLTLPSDWMAAAASGSKAKDGTWSGTVSADITAGYYRIVDSAGTTCHEQGSITRAFGIATSSSTAANGNVLTFAATTGVTAGMTIAGTGIPSGATVSAVDSTTVTMSATSTAGVGSAVTVYFGDTTGDLWLQNTALQVSQTITITEFVRTAPGA